jgi:hypothetical protein
MTRHIMVNSTWKLELFLVELLLTKYLDDVLQDETKHNCIILIFCKSSYQHQQLDPEVENNKTSYV